jgi:hypothetical protein
MEVLEICLWPFLYGWAWLKRDITVFFKYVYTDIFKFLFGHWYYMEVWRRLVY